MDLAIEIEENKNIEAQNTSNSTSDTEKNKKDHLKNSPKKMTINDFKIIRNLGKGSFAKVISAKNIHNNKNYAIKIIDKTFIEREDKVDQVHIERQLLSLFDHPNIIKLFSTFQNKKKLYFVLELAERGDLKEFITTQQILSYDLAKFFTAEIVNGLEYIHSKGFVHRDIKPENIILDSKYHLKIVDFATATCVGKYFDMKDKQFKEDNGDENKYPLIGTAEYISPEMINEGKCGIAGDLWALGCILYQFFHGFTPFFASTQHLIIQNIVNQNMTEISSTVNEEAKDLILQLLNYVPEKRLGAGSKNSENDYSVLKRHKFFKGIDFDRLSKIDPPFKTNFIQSPNSNKTPDLANINYKELSLDEDIFKINNFCLNMNYFGGDDIKLDSIKDLKKQNSKDSDLIKLEKMDTSEKNVITEEVTENKDSEIKKEEIIYEEILQKKSPWFHYNTRKLILFSDKIEYFDPVKNEKKGEIILNKNCIALIKDDFRFELFTPKRTYLFKLDNVGSKDWSDKINCVIEELKRKN